MEGPEENDQRQGTAAAIRASPFTLQEVWLRYFSLAGDVDEYEVDAYLSGMIVLPPAERDLIAHAVNELIDEIPALPRAPYQDHLPPQRTPEQTPEQVVQQRPPATPRLTATNRTEAAGREAMSPLRGSCAGAPDGFVLVRG
ncbi:hypothetical protein RCH21_003469 [Arthrobacter sp. PL16]|nr:hypothetical protein [Arthrobacter sp. PL16]